jgi:hypothetical protein
MLIFLQNGVQSGTVTPQKRRAAKANARARAPRAIATPTRPILARQAKNCHRAVRPTIAGAAAAILSDNCSAADACVSVVVRRPLSPAAAAAAAKRFGRISAELMARCISCISSIGSGASDSGAAARPNLTPDDLLTLAMTRRIGAAAVKASLDLLIGVTDSAAAAASVAMDLDSLGVSPVTSAYALDPLLWPRLCAIAAGDTAGIVSNDATGMLLRSAIAEASRRAVILVPAPVVVAAGKGATAVAARLGGGSGAVRGGGDGRLHWLLLVVLPAERAIECYDSRRQRTGKLESKTVGGIDGKGGNEGSRGNADDDDDRCWRALETVRTALVRRGLARYWNCSSESSQPLAFTADAACAGASDDRAAPVDGLEKPTAPTIEEDVDTDERLADSPWQLRIVRCAQQQQQLSSTAAAAAQSTNGRAHKASGGKQSGSKRGAGASDGGSGKHDADGDDGDADDDYDADGNASATYMLWFARCILLEDDARSLTQPPPPGFRRQIVRELFDAGRR